MTEAVDKARQQAAAGDTAALDNARQANSDRYKAQLQAGRTQGLNNHSDAEIDRRTQRVAGMTPGVFGGSGQNNDWGPT